MSHKNRPKNKELVVKKEVNPKARRNSTQIMKLDQLVGKRLSHKSKAEQTLDKDEYMVFADLKRDVKEKDINKEAKRLTTSHRKDKRFQSELKTIVNKQKEA